MTDIDHGLMHWNSHLSHERQVELTTWYRSLSPEDQKKVYDIRQEGYEDGAYDSETT